MSKIGFYHYSSKTQLETDITSGERKFSDIVFIDDNTEGTLIWTHNKYYSLSETEFKNFLDLYSSNDIIVGSYVPVESALDIEETDSINDALAKLEYKINQKSETTNTYYLSLDDDGTLSCIKNETENGFTLSDDGILSLKS